jgi:hypothetical protein
LNALNLSERFLNENNKRYLVFIMRKKTRAFMVFLKITSTLITEGKFPTPWGVTLFLGDERIHTQEPQRDGADVPLGVSCEVSKSGI